MEEVPVPAEIDLRDNNIGESGAAALLHMMWRHLMDADETAQTPAPLAPAAPMAAAAGQQRSGSLGDRNPHWRRYTFRVHLGGNRVPEQLLAKVHRYEEQLEVA